MSRIIRNESLYNLGVVLIELWYGKQLSQLHHPEDGPIDSSDARTSLMSCWNTADRLVDELYSEAGGIYSDAVRRCIRCDFGRHGSTLEDLSFLKAVYEGVVEPLQRNYDYIPRASSPGSDGHLV
ncbi:hypothetical protein K469DRAFT_695706 [Zopfia rhizophila CBS 207.26]|uniref:DUF7580 domain-containing protein n=1 Tax=Zopfia rhizophila CBS 207.26 TaxID=1314779 RepID=A0A6A6DIU9_9PEZI|nr:hypothetical protein K469DRAFT_695706 [Zopfia rhizophila CBS 207.26]